MDCVSHTHPHLEYYLLAYIGDADKALENREGWGELKVKTPDHGVATHVYASFDPGLNSTWIQFLQSFFF